MAITGAQIKAAREFVDEPQEVFCLRFGVRQPTLWRWEEEGPPENGAAAKCIELVVQPILDKMTKATAKAVA